MGRFTHEALAVDPDTGIVYETEDAGNNSGFYRFLPNQVGNLAAGGKLQMLGVEGRPQFNTRLNQTMGATYPAVWFDIADPDHAHQPNTTNGQGVYRQGFEQGGARLSPPQSTRPAAFRAAACPPAPAIRDLSR